MDSPKKISATHFVPSPPPVTSLPFGPSPPEQIAPPHPTLPHPLQTTEPPPSKSRALPCPTLRNRAPLLHSPLDPHVAAGWESRQRWVLLAILPHWRRRLLLPTGVRDCSFPTGGGASPSNDWSPRSGGGRPH